MFARNQGRINNSLVASRTPHPQVSNTIKGGPASMVGIGSIMRNSNVMDYESQEDYEGKKM
jgi:hypothetical protein